MLYNYLVSISSTHSGLLRSPHCFPFDQVIIPASNCLMQQAYLNGRMNLPLGTFRDREFFMEGWQDKVRKRRFLLVVILKTDGCRDQSGAGFGGPRASFGLATSVGWIGRWDWLIGLLP